MRKILIIMTMGLLLTQTMTAQVHDEEKYLQWRSMETGPLEFAPKMYYYLFHNSYAHHRWEWEWHGFKSGLYLHLKPDESDAKPVVPKRHRKRTSSISWSKKPWLQQTAEWMLPTCYSRMTSIICRIRFLLG